MPTRTGIKAMASVICGVGATEVITALNRNMPFDQFTVEQLAGDMLEGATLEQKIASGFNRNHRGNAEGGIIPQEYAVEYVVDRVDTTATVWLGLTLGCARCHDHKFDPVTQKEFYELFALFNNVPERGRAIKYGNSDPQIKAPTPAQQAEQLQLDERLADVRTRFKNMRPQIAEAQTEWERTLGSRPLADWSPGDALLLHLPLNGNTADLCHAARATTTMDETLKFCTGQVGEAAEFSGKQSVDVGDVANFGYFSRFSISLWIQPHNGDGVVLGRMAEGADYGGYNLQLNRGKLQLNLIARWLDDALRVETTEPLRTDRWQHVVVTYDGSAWPLVLTSTLTGYRCSCACSSTNSIRISLRNNSRSSLAQEVLDRAIPAGSTNCESMVESWRPRKPSC